MSYIVTVEKGNPTIREFHKIYLDERFILTECGEHFNLRLNDMKKADWTIDYRIEKSNKFVCDGTLEEIAEHMNMSLKDFIGLYIEHSKYLKHEYFEGNCQLAEDRGYILRKMEDER